MKSHEMAWLVGRYVCSRCWHHLLIVKMPGQGEMIVCSNQANCDGRGYVTRRYAERRREESKFELLEVKANYPQLVRRPQMNERNILERLGF